MGKPHEVVKLDARKEVEHAYPSHDKLRCYFNPVPPTSLEVPAIQTTTLRLFCIPRWSSGCVCVWFWR